MCISPLRKHLMYYNQANLRTAGVTCNTSRFLGHMRAASTLDSSKIFKFVAVGVALVLFLCSFKVLLLFWFYSNEWKTCKTKSVTYLFWQKTPTGVRRTYLVRARCSAGRVAEGSYRTEFQRPSSRVMICKNKTHLGLSSAAVWVS